MYLKKIVIQGFKSFADNTIIDLENNIAGIVGPNGSGKSNIVDAIRWVLGEQSVKSLRGDNLMSDVIFSGSKSRNPMNVASVTLILDNSDHYLNIAFDEVSIKRRLYKDGTNEFFINNEKCRLKDVSDLLMDSGIAKESFNIISQGKIDDILSSKPENRRVIFEEAAGVLKYKKRKEEALKKLEKTDNNISRINDIINELETQIEPLRDQKIKAEKYLTLNDELKELEISLIANDITNINYKYQNNKEEIDKLNKELISLNTNNSTNLAKTSSYKLDLSNIELEIKKLQNKLLNQIKVVEQINAKKQIILERQKFEVDDKVVHDNIVKLKEEELNIKNWIHTNELDINLNNNKIDNINSDINELDLQINLIKSNKNNNLDELNSIVRKLSILSTKIDSLQDDINNNNNLPYSVRKVLENPKLRGIHNILGSLFDVEEKYSKAISICLGANTSNIIVDNELCAKEAILYLKNNNIGRVTFFPLNKIDKKEIDNNTLNIIKNDTGFIDIAANLVKCENKYINIIKNQLGNVIVVDNIDTANIISNKINYKYRVVTLDGEITHVGGAITGGIIKTRNIITDKYELENSLKEKDNLILNQKTIEEKINSQDHEMKAIEDKLYLLNKDKIEMEQQIKYLNNKNIEFNNKLNEITLEIDTNNNSLNKITNLEEDVLNEYYEASKIKNDIENNIELLTNKENKIKEELEEFEYTIKKENSLYNEKNNLMHELEIEINRADVKLDNLLNILNETYSMTYENAIKLYKLDLEENIARNKVNSLKKQIKDLGPINVIAPEEYKKLSERYEFLIHQQEDLKKAQNTLLEIIDEMDDVMKKEFISTFKIIEQNFSITFKELFKGGNARLVLTDSNNILETGVEIEACPPGKTLKSISLLSGGEKTFTAISLLFAILKSREVPFCILDEVEAALDEVNVESFGEYITKLKKKTQFILITHKKKTMEFADILYGITMQESGVSKLVSVKLEELK